MQNHVEVLDSMLDWEVLFDSRLDGDERTLDDLEADLLRSARLYSTEEEQKIVVLLLENLVHPEFADKALRCLCMFIHSKVTEPILVSIIADKLYDYFASRENPEFALNAIKTVITEMPRIDIMPWDKNSRSVQLAVKLVESLAPRIAGGMTKANITESVELMGVLLRHFGSIMRLHAKLDKMGFIGNSPYFCTGVELGKGSYAKVFLGRHIQTAEVVAIKVMDWDQLTKGKDKIRQALESEIRIMNESNHPNIVRLYDSVREGCNLNLILEYCGGGSLEEYLLKKGPLSEEETLHWLHELALGLKFLHDRSIVHRDLKPGNLLLSSDQPNANLKITDFTFARFLDPGDLAATMVGTPLYMAPEIFRGKYTEKSDLWSLGVLVYQMLTGTVPYIGSNMAELLTNIHTTELRWPESLKISANMKDLLISLLQKNADLRISWTEFFLHPCLRVMEPPKEEEPAAEDEDNNAMETSVLVTTKNAAAAGEESSSALRAELAAKTKELKETKEALTIAEERLASTQEELEAMATKVLFTEMAMEERDSKEKEQKEKANAEKKGLEDKIAELKNQLLIMAASKIRESSNEELEALRNENLRLLDTVENLTKEIEVYKIAMLADAADAGVKDSWRRFFSG